jgi:hypothetical protein
MRGLKYLIFVGNILLKLFSLKQILTVFRLISMGVRQGVAMDSLKLHMGLRGPTFLCPASGRAPEMVIAEVAHPTGGRPGAVFNPLGHPTPYA